MSIYDCTGGGVFLDLAFASAPRSAKTFRRSPNGISANPASPGRVVLVHGSGQADSADSHEVLCPSAPAHRAALSGAAGLRTIPLRLLGWFLAAPPEVFGHQMEPTSLPMRYFAVSRSHRSSRDDQMRFVAAGHASRLSCFVRDVPLPARRLVSRLRRNHLSRRRSWALVPSQCYSCSGDFGAFPLLFPHMPSMNFHLGYFSRDRPTDTFNLFERLEA